MLVGGVLLTGCSGEENIQLKKVEILYELPKEAKEKAETKSGVRKRPNSSAKIGHDPSGVNKQ
jgi:hypothetical protein